MVSVGMGDKNGTNALPLEQGEVRQRVCFSIDAHTGIDDNPLVGKLNSKTACTNATRTT
jgi:hypothetical protein